MSESDPIARLLSASTWGAAILLAYYVVVLIVVEVTGIDRSFAVFLGVPPMPMGTGIRIGDLLTWSMVTERIYARSTRRYRSKGVTPR